MVSGTQTPLAWPELLAHRCRPSSSFQVFADSANKLKVQRLTISAPLIGLSQLFQNNFGNNRLRLELENYSSLMGQNVSTKITKGQKGAREKCK